MSTAPVTSAADAASNWAAAMASPTTQTKYTQGVNRVTVSPTAAAASADALNRYQQNTAQAVASGRMAAALNNVSLQAWQAAVAASAGNLSRNAQAKKAKQAAAAVKLQPVWQAMRNAANSLPKGGVANAVARVQAALQIQAQMTGH
jgi:hypothetical protein